jgi:hypothetical protein
MIAATAATLRASVPKLKTEMIMGIAVGIVVGLLALGSMFGPAKDNSPREGDACGPHHHWVQLGPDVASPDLSCEEDR